MPLPADVLAGDGRPGWIGYVGVEDVDAATEGVRLAGGPPPARPPTSPTSAASPSSPIRRVCTCCSRPWAVTGHPRPPNTGLCRLARALRDGLAESVRLLRRAVRLDQADAVDMGPMGTYQLFAVGGTPIGGTMNKPDAIPRRLGSIINVAEADAAAARVTEHGGQILNGPQQAWRKLDPALPGSARSDVRARRPEPLRQRSRHPPRGRDVFNQCGRPGVVLGRPPGSGCRPDAGRPPDTLRVAPGAPRERWRCGVTNQSAPGGGLARRPTLRIGRYGAGARTKPPQGRRPSGTVASRQEPILIGTSCPAAASRASRLNSSAIEVP